LNNDLLAEVGALPATVPKTLKHTLSGSIWRPLGIMAVLTRDTRNAKEPYPILVQSAKRLPMTPKVFFRWVAWLLVLAIVVVTLSPIELRPITKVPAGLERFAAFAAIGVAFCLGYPRHRLHILVLLIGGIGFLEVAQNHVSGRHGRLPDGLMKASGALLGAAFATFVDRNKRAP